MDPEEFYAWLDMLGPAEREQALYDFGFMGANEVPGVYGGASPQLSMADYGLGSYGQLPPELNKKGEIVPWGLDQETQAFNALQDVGAMTVDPALALYGGTGAYDPEAFQPTQIPIGTPLDMSDQRYLEGLVNAQGGGYQSYLAQKIQSGMDPGSAVASMWEFINMGGEEEVDPEQAAARKSLIASLPPSMQTDPLGRGLPSQQGKVGDYSTPEGRAASVDLQGVLKTAENLFERQSKIPQVGYVDPETGLPFAGARTEDSPLAQKYRAAGIPLPTETYGDEEWLNAALTEEDVLGRQEREGKAQKGYETAIGDVRTATSNASTLEKQLSDFLAAQEKGVQRGGDAANPYGLPQDLWAEARQTADRQWQDVSKNVAAHGAPKLSDIQGTFGEGLLPSAMSRDADEAYRQAMQDWQSEKRLGLYDTEQQRAAESLLNTPPSVRVDAKTGAPSPIYDFGGTPRENAAADRGLSAISDLIPFGGGSDYEVRPLGRPLVQAAQNRVGTTRQARQRALDEQIRQHEITSGTEAARASSAGRADALMRLGRTPTNDVLMQRAMARRMLMGR